MWSREAQPGLPYTAAAPQPLPHTAACHRPLARGLCADHDRAQTDDDAPGGVTRNQREVNDRDDAGKSGRRAQLIRPTGGSVVLRGVPVAAVQDRLAQTREDLEDLILAVRPD